MHVAFLRVKLYNELFEKLRKVGGNKYNNGIKICTKENNEKFHKNYRTGINKFYNCYDIFKQKNFE